MLLLYLLLAIVRVSTSAAESCRSTKGAFGQLEGSVQHVPVAYQLELQLGTAIETVLATVEIALVDQLLSYTFRECTEDELITDVISGIQSRALRPVDGVACPTTTTTTTTTTTASSLSDSICFIVRGQLDVYLADPHAAGIIKQAIAMDVQAVLDHHSVEHATSEEVVAVSFVDVYTLPAEDVVTHDASTSDQTSYVSLFVVNMLLVSLALVCHRRQVRQDGSQYLPMSS
eukprot:scaffold3040_cov152-Amphora_coffeaeformis.AAC.3